MTRSIVCLEGLRLGGHTLAVRDLRPLRRSGWTGFRLFLRDREGRLGASPVIEGIHSAGGKGIRRWMDLEYREETEFPAVEVPAGRISLRDLRLDEELFRALGELVPPGGHLMVSYETEGAAHGETLVLLGVGVPPAATPLGFLIFRAGFALVKDWYLAEGGHEGPRKLWGEKAPDTEWEEIFREKTERQIREFLGRPPRVGFEAREEGARRRAEAILALPGRH